MSLRPPVVALPPVGLLRQVFRYDPETGRIYNLRKVPREGAELELSSKCRLGYIRARVRHGGRQVEIAAQRLAWALHYGEHPPQSHDVDHINRIKTDNRVSNLRLADTGLNSRNRENARKDEAEATGYARVASASGDSLQAQIGRGGRYFYLGRFKTEAEARAAFVAAERVLKKLGLAEAAS